MPALAPEPRSNGRFNTSRALALESCGDHYSINGAMQQHLKTLTVMDRTRPALRSSALRRVAASLLAVSQAQADQGR
jgi:hypothetical protein